MKTGLEKLHEFCTRAGEYPSRLAIKNELERLLAEEVTKQPDHHRVVCDMCCGSGFETTDRYDAPCHKCGTKGYIEVTGE